MLTATSACRAVPIPSVPVPTVTRIDRRRRDANAARFAERVMQFSRWLPLDEAALVRGVYQAGRSARELAALTKVSSRAVQRRLRRIVERTLSRDFRFAARQLELAPIQPDWPPSPGSLHNADERSVHLATLRAIFIEGLSLRAATKKLDLPLHVVRRHQETARLELEARHD
jgi:DNA-directed RNA polymerase specialized sigma24 family protein